MALITVKQASALLNISPATVYALVAEGRIRAHRFGLKRGTIRISEEALEAYCRATTSGYRQSESDEKRCPSNDKESAQEPVGNVPS